VRADPVVAAPEVGERLPGGDPHPNDHTLAYLLTKRDRMGHDLPDLDLPAPFAEPVAEPFAGPVETTSSTGGTP
jgi:hypothetical protein